MATDNRFLPLDDVIGAPVPTEASTAEQEHAAPRATSPEGSWIFPTSKKRALTKSTRQDSSHLEPLPKSLRVASSDDTGTTQPQEASHGVGQPPGRVLRPRASVARAGSPALPPFPQAQEQPPAQEAAATAVPNSTPADLAGFTQLATEQVSRSVPAAGTGPVLEYPVIPCASPPTAASVYADHPMDQGENGFMPAERGGQGGSETSAPTARPASPVPAGHAEDGPGTHDFVFRFPPNGSIHNTRDTQVLPVTGVADIPSTANTPAPAHVAAPGQPQVPNAQPALRPAPAPTTFASAAAAAAATAVTQSVAAGIQPNAYGVMGKPPTSWPYLHGISQDTLFAGMPYAALQSWRALDVPKLLAVPANSEPFDQRRQPNHVHGLKHGLHAVCGNEPDVAPPQLDAAYEGKGCAAYLVAGLSQQQVEIMVQRCVLSTTRGTWFLVAFDHGGTTFVGTLQGLFIPPDETGSQEVLRLVAATLCASPAIANFLALQNDAIPPTSPSPLSYILASISVEHMVIVRSNAEVVLWNIYIEFPCTEQTQRAVWTATLRGLSYSDPFRGAGVFMHASFRCKVCNGPTHPTGLCPFAASPYWCNTGLQASPNTAAPTGDTVSRRGRGTPSAARAGGTRRGRGARAW